jgi:hypothetical protein
MDASAVCDTSILPHAVSGGSIPKRRRILSVTDDAPADNASRMPLRYALTFAQDSAACTNRSAPPRCLRSASLNDPGMPLVNFSPWAQSGSTLWYDHRSGRRGAQAVQGWLPLSEAVLVLHKSVEQEQVTQISGNPTYRPFAAAESSAPRNTCYTYSSVVPNVEDQGGVSFACKAVACVAEI